MGRRSALKQNLRIDGTLGGSDVQWDLELSGTGMRLDATSVVYADTPYEVTVNDGLLLVNAGDGNVTIDLYTAGSNDGAVVTVKRTDGSTNTVTVDGNGAETIDGRLTWALSQQYASLTIVSDGTNWLVVGGSVTTETVTRCIDQDSTESETPASTVETLLRTFTVPAGTLFTNGDYLDVWYFGEYATTGGIRELRLSFGGHMYLDNGVNITAQLEQFIAHGRIIRLTSTTVDMNGFIQVGTTGGSGEFDADVTAAAFTVSNLDTTALELKITGENASAAAGGITYTGSVITRVKF